MARHPAYADAYVLLGGIYEKEGNKAMAEGVYNKGLAAEGVPEGFKFRLKARLDAVKAAANTGSEKK